MQPSGRVAGGTDRPAARIVTISSWPNKDLAELELSLSVLITGSVIVGFAAWRWCTFPGGSSDGSDSRNGPWRPYVRADDEQGAAEHVSAAGRDARLQRRHGGCLHGAQLPPPGPADIGGLL